MWKVFRILLDAVLVLAIVTFTPGFPPYGDMAAYQFAPAMPLEGPLAPNEDLNHAEKLFEGVLRGPEAFAVSPDRPDEIYTGLADGSVVRISQNGTKIEKVTQFGQKCTREWEAEKCGRPLGIRFDHDGNLIAADAYYGIYKIDPKTGKYENLVPKDAKLDGKPARLFNSVVAARDGKIYWSDSSSNYPLHQGMGEMIGSPSGRLFRYDPETKDNTLLLDKLHFANGVALSPDEDFVLVVECGSFRIMKYWLKGPNKGKSEVFIEGLPGTPDNLSLSPSGNPIVGLITIRFPGQWNVLEFLGKLPLLRKLLLRLGHMIKLPMDLAAQYLDLPLAHQISHQLLSLSLPLDLMPPYGIVLEMDWNGHVVRSWHSNTKQFRLYSEAVIVGDYMYLGSPWNDYLGRLHLSG